MIMSNFIMPSYAFIIVGTIVGLVVGLITTAILSSGFDEDYPWLAGIIVFVVIWVVSLGLNSAYNKRIYKRNNIYVTTAVCEANEACEEKLSDINAFITERNNTLINLADIVKSYDEYESALLRDIVLAKANISYKAVLSQIQETYPNVRSIENYAKLINQLENTEENIRNARLAYNEAVKEYNAIINNDIFMEYASAKNLPNARSYLEDSVMEDFNSVRIMTE